MAKEGDEFFESFRSCGATGFLCHAPPPSPCSCLHVVKYIAQGLYVRLGVKNYEPDEIIMVFPALSEIGVETRRARPYIARWKFPSSEMELPEQVPTSQRVLNIESVCCNAIPAR